MIHRFWDGPNKPAYTRFTAGLIGRPITEWTLDTLPGAMADRVTIFDHLVPEGLLPRHRANIARLLLLHSFGGIWLDYDVLLLEPLADSPGMTASVSGEVCSAVMSFPAGDRRLMEVYRAIAPGEDVKEISGQGLIERTIGDRIIKRELPYASDGSKLNPHVWAIHMFGSWD